MVGTGVSVGGALFSLWLGAAIATVGGTLVFEAVGTGVAVLVETCATTSCVGSTTGAGEPQATTTMTDISVSEIKSNFFNMRTATELDAKFGDIRYFYSLAIK